MDKEKPKEGLEVLEEVMSHLQEMALAVGPEEWLDPRGGKLSVRVPCPKEMREIFRKTNLVSPRLVEGFYHLLVLEGLTRVAEKIKRREEAGDEK